MPPRPRALVADDDSAIRALLALCLEPAYDVTAVDNGTDAERVLLTDPPPAVAVLDCVMPGLSGPTVLARVRAAGCRVPVLLVSGSADPAASGPANPRSAFLPKPFSPDQLVRAVAALTGPPSGPTP